MSRTDPQLKFRVSQELRDRLEDAARANKRSLTAEITARLESSFVPEPPANYLEIAREDADKSELSRLLYEALVLMSQARGLMLREGQEPDPKPSD